MLTRHATASLIDLTDQRIGYLHVVSLAPIGLSPDMDVSWRCRCICGNQVDVEGYRLRQQLVGCCGCNGRPAQKAGSESKEGRRRGYLRGVLRRHQRA